MRRSIIAFVSFLIGYTVVAQPQGPGGNRAMTGGNQITGSFYGKLIDSKTLKPVEYASVQLVQNRMDTATKKRKDVVIGGMLTKTSGEFNLPNIPVFGQFKLKISAIGFKPYEQSVSFDLKMGGDMTSMMTALDKDLGNIKIDLEEKMMENVTVTGSKPTLQLGIDRKIFNVDKNIVSIGGTAVDVMKNVPLVNVDIDGNVTMRNNAPQIFVDGRPTTMQLDQIPADAIESVEIITNPSAKFDASGGTAGILNIVLKKNRKVGYNGSIRASIDSRWKPGFGGDINLRQDKINFFLNGNYGQRKSVGNGTTERLSLIDNPDNILHQTDKSSMLGKFGFGRTGFDYFITNRTTLSASLNFGKGHFTPGSISDLLIDTLKSPVVSSLSKRIANTDGNFRNLGTTVSIKHNFPKNGQEWTADLTFNSRKNDNTNSILTDYFKSDLTTLDYMARQQQIGNGRNKNLVFQSDYSNPLGDNSKFELGVRAAFNENSSTNAFYTVDPNTGALTLQPASQVDYESKDHVLAAYATFSNRIKDFGYQLGLRAESSNYKGTLTKTHEDFNIDFPISFFPSVFLNQKLKNDQELQLNYSRRINRPNFFQLTPFTDSSDFLNLSKGNPGLQPEFTNSLEMSYSKTFKNKDNLLLTAYYKNTNHLITRYQIVNTEPLSGKQQIINTYINANSSYVTGLEMIMRNKVTKWWDLTSNLNFFTSKINIDDPSIPKQDQFASWLLKINNTFKLPKNFTAQLSGDYQSKTILPPGGSGSGGRGGGGGMMMFGSSTSAQGYVRPVYGVDFAVRYEFMKNKQASIAINVNDIFRTRVSDVHSESPYFIQDAFRRRDPQVLRINFSWRFGKFDASLFKRKNMKNQTDNSMDMNMGQ
ncbi:MAG TPA: outer membrane beta-barrel protein [Chitinophagaceae bacterium]|nr:outer membrane beta-barrel protein [Chitinophagaceae bacterium]